MTENSEKNSGEQGQDFDMYHFFSRKDVILAIILLLALLLYLVGTSLFGGEAA